MLTRNETTGKNAVKRIVSTSHSYVDATVTVTLADAKSGQVVQTLTGTRRHPFYVEGKGFVPAGALAIGNSIVTRAGPALVVQSVTWNRRAEGYDLYNFVVEDYHTYFVGKANGGAWVHNVECPFDLSSDPRITGGPLQAGQHEVRKPVIDAYIKRAQNGEVPPPIVLEGNVIIEGHHRYIAGRLAGTEVPTVQRSGPSSLNGPRQPVPWDKVYVNPN